MDSSLRRVRRATSVENHAAINVDGLAGDVPRSRGGEEDREGGDVLGMVGTAERDGGVPTAYHVLDGETFLPRTGGHVPLRQRGDGGAWTDRVDVDVVAGKLEGGDTGERDHAAFAGGVDRVRGARVPLAGDRGDVDNDAACLGDHLPRHPLQAEEHTLRVDAREVLPVRLGEIHDLGAPRNDRVVHVHVDSG